MIKARAKLKSKNQIAHYVWEFTFEMVDPKVLEFESGQYVSIIVDTKTRRPYSIVSSPLTSENEFVLIVDVKPNGLGVNHLLNLNVNDEISFIGPIGNFVMPKALAKNLFFVATGTGIAPLKSMIDTLVANKSYLDHNIFLHFGTRFADDLFYTEVFEGYVKDGKIKEYVKYLSQAELPGAKTGYATQFITDMSNEIIWDSQFYLCGGASMVKSAQDMLLGKGVPISSIFHEKFN